MIAWDDDSVPVGVCVIRWDGGAEREALEAYPDCPEVTNLQVHRAQRGRGAGTALMEAAEKEVRARGLRRIGVGVADDNPRAAMLYARLGYADTGLRTDSRYVYPDDAGVPREIIEHNILLVKDLEVVSPAEGPDSASAGRS
jgi:ribosomal protein S18 acetylase RimI-like enzyme